MCKCNSIEVTDKAEVEQDRCIYCGCYPDNDEQNWDGICPNCNFLMGIGELDDIEPYTYWDAEDSEVQS